MLLARLMLATVSIGVASTIGAILIQNQPSPASTPYAVGIAVIIGRVLVYIEQFVSECFSHKE